MLNDDEAKIFEAARPNLLGLSYRILGSLADAEDAVQDTFLKWAKVDRQEIEKPAAWLTTTCTRRCIDLLRSAHRTRVSYVGEWLPEPIHTLVEHEAEERMELASSLSTAFMLILERLSPKERAAYLLHQIFEIPYSEISDTLGIRESACRKLVSRAKANVDQAKVRHTVPTQHQAQLLAAFQEAITSGVIGPLTSFLSNDVRLSADGGGKVAALLEVLHGKDDVINFVSNKLPIYWVNHKWVEAEINGTRGVILKHVDKTVAAVTFAFDEAGMANNIFITRNPDKLARLETISIH